MQFLGNFGKIIRQVGWWMVGASSYGESWICPDYPKYLNGFTRYSPKYLDQFLTVLLETFTTGLVFGKQNKGPQPYVLTRTK